MKLKVCVVTFFKHNYGAFLQAYSLQKFLLKAGYSPYVLDYDYAKDHTIFGVSVTKLKNPISFAKNIAYRISLGTTTIVKDRIFAEAAKKYIIQSDYYKTYKSVLENPPKADIYVVGSDQVWNPNMARQGLQSRMLQFVREESSIRCSFAASMGILYLNGADINIFKKGLSKFDSISVREARAAVTLGDVTDKEILVHKDPALLLNTEEWSEFAESIYDEKPYVFLYLAQRSDDLVEFTKKIAEKNNWKIVNCPASVNYSIDSVNGNKILSPMEFVGGVKNAAYVVTNSFHCLVFSIHFKKKAYVSLPPKGSARLSELIDFVGVQRLTDPTEMTEEAVSETYSIADEQLSKVRESASDYFTDLNAKWETKNAR